MNFFGIGLPEMAVIAAIGLLVFGPKRLPELGRSLGRTLKGFQSASSEFEKEFRTAIATVETPAPEVAALDQAAPLTPTEPAQAQVPAPIPSPAPAAAPTPAPDAPAS